MSIVTELQLLQDNIGNAYTKIEEKGGAIPSHKNTNNLTAAIDSIPSGGGQDINVPREIINGVYQTPKSLTSYSLPNGANDLGPYTLYYSFYGSTALTSADLSGVVNITGEYALNGAFFGCTNLSSLNLENLTAIRGSASCAAMCRGCTSLVSCDLSRLQEISAASVFSTTFFGCTNIESMSFDNLTTITANSVFNSTFRECTNLHSLYFPSLTTLADTSINNNYFTNMLLGCSNVNVHFPAAMKSIIKNFSATQNGYKGTNTTILYDL